MNVFLIESPFQLLNAIEAKHRLGLTENILIVILGYGHARSEFQNLIIDGEWSRIKFIRIRNRRPARESRIDGMRISRKVRNFAEIYLIFLNKSTIDRTAKSLPSVDSVVLGNYLEDGSQYLRHFANSVKHNNLYLIDDGTDVIRVNTSRNRRPQRGIDLNERVDRLSPWTVVKSNIRALLVKLDNREADRVVFFTAYDIEASDRDEVVKNEYAVLRENIAGTLQTEDVHFLGQCLIEDKWIDRDVYFGYLRRVKIYFEGEDILYIPHPRESADTINYVNQGLGFKIKKLDGPVEYCLSVSSARPKILASFFCSALLNCSIIYQGLFGIKAFYIDPQHMIYGHDFVRDIYEYFGTKAHGRLEVIKL